MVMQRESIPPPGPLDPYTRIDEVLTHLLAVETELLRVLKGIASRPEITPDLKNRLESMMTVPYDVKEFALDTARTDTEVIVQGDLLLAASDGVLTGCSVRLNNQANMAVDLALFNPIIMPFTKLYLTTSAQAGKKLKLFIGGEAAAEAATSTVTVSTSQQFNIMRTDKDVHFTGALVQYAKEDENITGLLVDKVRVTGITIESDQRLHYKLLFWYRDSFDDTDLDLDEFCGEVDLDLATYGIQIGGAGQWYLDIRGLHLDYQDLDTSKELHVSLYNAGAIAKNAGATGEVRVTVTYEPRA